MMFNDLMYGRLVFKTLIYFIGKPLPAVLAEYLCQLFI